MKKLSIVGTLSLLSASAAAISPSAAPVLSQQQIDAVKNDPKIVSPRDPHSGLNLGVWNGISLPPLAPAERSAAAATSQYAVPKNLLDADFEIFQAPLGPVNVRKAAVRINDNLAAIGREILPAVADEFGLAHVPIASRTLYYARGNCSIFELRLQNVYAELPLDSDAVSGSFADGRKLRTDFDVPGGEVHAELNWRITHFDGPWGCFSTPMNYTASFTVRDFDGELDVTLKSTGATVGVQSVDKARFEVDDFSWGTNSWILNTLLTLGYGLYDLFDFSCSGQAACLTEAINEYALTDDDLLDVLVEAVNEALKRPLTITQGFSSDGVGLDFSATLDSLQSSDAENSFTSLWDFDVNAAAAVDPCAASLSVRAFTFEGAPGNASLTQNDFEVELPFHAVSDAAYFAGKQGVFCAAFNYSIAGIVRGFSVVPHGSIGVAGGDAGDPANTVKLSLPIKVTPTSAAVAGSITGTLNVKGSLSVDGGSDVVFTTRSATVSGLAGSVSVGGIAVSATTLAGTINNAAAGVVSKLPDLELANAVSPLLGGLTVGVGEILTQGAALVVGLDVDG